MKPAFLFFLFCGLFLLLLAFPSNTNGQTADSVRLPYRFRDNRLSDFRKLPDIFLPNPGNIKRTVEFDPLTRRYILQEKIGDQLYKAPRYLTIEEYQEYVDREITKDLRLNMSAARDSLRRSNGLIPAISVDNEVFNRIFGGSMITIRPQGTADVTFAGKINKNENPLLTERQRKQFSLDLDQRIQMNVVGQVGNRLRIATNYNSEAQFDFENQIKLDKTGNPDDILQRIEIGNVSLPLNSTLITGSQALFGVKTQLQFGRLNVTSIFSQQKSQHKEITVANGSQQNEFRLSADNYEANRHYFLAQSFRNEYNAALEYIPLIRSNVNVTKIEVWITNRTNSSTDSRDVLALMDLGENAPYRKELFQGGSGYSRYPAGTIDAGFPQQSNNLLQVLPQDALLSNSNAAYAFFQSSGGTDNYSKLSYARKLTEQEYVLHPRLGYISLNFALNADEVLAVAYRYTINGVEYQVGQFASDVPVNPNEPRSLLTKLLKNENLKTSLPTWDLMMKNIYSLGAYQVSKENFKLNIYRLDEETGVEKPQITEGQNTTGKLWLQLTNLDRLNQVNDAESDGIFDFIEGITVDPQYGRITFPLVEPFGKDLAAKFSSTEQSLINKYVFQALYDSTRTNAQQLFQKYNRYIIRGTYQSEISSEFQLNATNVPEGSVQVVAGTLPLVEGTDFTVDYTIGRVRILNEAMLKSGQPIRIKLESNELFGLQQRTLFGSRFDYTLSDKLQVGGTFMNLSEKPLSAKVNFGEEPISNTMWGVDANYSSESRWLTHLLNKLPFINTREASSITFSGEYAKLVPGHSGALDFAGSRGVSYLDDFEGTRSVIDLKSAIGWQISGTPRLFPESELNNDLSYGFNRARLAFYNIDPVFYRRGSSLASAGIPTSTDELSNHYVRQVFEQEVFPLKQSVTGIPLALPTLDLAFYPMLRGPYNYSTTDVDAEGLLINPRNRWGGLFRKLESTDFEAQNVEYVELWMLDPFIYRPDSKGGDLYINLGNISEDILKDGRKSLENGLPANGSEDQTELTKWGRVPKLQPVNQAFENSAEARKTQDVGLDGLNDDAEARHFSDFVNQISPRLRATVASELTRDPSSDNFQYYRDAAFDNTNAGILRRYERYNNTEGNSRTADQSLTETGLSNAAATSLPDGEDINRDNNMSLTDEYYQYKVSIRPGDMVVGQNYIADKVTSNVKLANGSTQQVSWYQFRIPISQYQQRVGSIEDFKSIRFMRVFLTDFVDSAVIRLAKLQLVRGEWRKYNSEENTLKVLADPALGTSPGLDNSSIEVSTINIEENGKRTPIPYVVPPGIRRERDLSSYRGDAEQNEQSLSLQVKNLRDGYARAAFKTAYTDFRSYGKLEMFIHAEGEQLRDKEISAIIRIGSDNQDNYYEYEIPLAVTVPGTNDAYAIWPDNNKLDLAFSKLQAAKVARNRASLGGLPWPVNIPFEYADGLRTIRIVGQPDLSKVRIYMLGVKNPLRKSGLDDDGLDKSAQVWFNELRLSEFDERGGWAATARLNAKLADLGEVSVSGSKSTVGFGSIDRRTSERNRSDDRFFDLASTLELGKFFPQRTGMQIPVFLNWSSQLSVPQFDPSSQDIELKTTLSGLSKELRDSIHRVVDDYTRRRSINFTNVRKIRTNPADKLRLWDIENWSASYAYNEYDHRDFINERAIQKTYRASLAYNYSNRSQPIMPFAKVIKSNQLALLRDFNFSLLPSLLNFRIDVDRLYSENSLRNNDPANVLPLTTFNKNFQMSRLYGISWNLTRALQLDFNATNYSIIDEPRGRINGMVRDTIWENLKKLGRTTDYNHNLNLTYNVPLNKIPALNWTTAVVRYGTTFNWTTESTNTLRNPEIMLGNSIQNSRTIQINPSLNFVRLYNKFDAFRRTAREVPSFSTFMKDMISGLKSMTGAYTLTQGTFLPGYTPGTNVLGYDLDEDAPGWAFLFGSQQDIRTKAVSQGWISKDTLLNQLYVTNKKEDISIRATIEPIKDLRIELTATKSSNFNYSTNFKFNSAIGDFESQSPITSGDFSISSALIRTAFSSIDNSDLFEKFQRNRSIVSARLGAANPNSQGISEGYSNGYGKNAQDVVVASFIAAYTGKSAESVSLNTFPKIPIPNWRVSYNGLTKYDMFSNFASFNLNHSYRSTYNVNGFSSLIRYQEENGFVSIKDGQGNYLPVYQFSQVMLFEQFVPLIGVDFRLKNNMSANFEYRKTRGLSLSLTNSQLAQQQDNGIVFGMGYRSADFRFPFGFLRGRKTKNDVNLKLDVAVNDRKTVIYRADVQGAEVYSGARNVALRPSMDYLLNQRLNIRLFYDASLSRPYTSQTFNTSFSNFGINLRFTVQ